MDGMATALVMAVERGARASEVVRLLLTVPGIEVNGPKFSRCTPLHNAVKANRVKVVKMLLNHPDVDPNLVDSWGETAAMKIPWRLGPDAVRDVVEALLRSPKVDIHRKDADGVTLLDRAIQVYDEDAAWVWEAIDAKSRSPKGHIDQGEAYGLAMSGQATVAEDEEVAELPGDYIFRQ